MLVLMLLLLQLVVCAGGGAGGLVASLLERPSGYVWASRPLLSQDSVANEQVCRARCLAMPRCNFGTFLPGYGTCWLAAHPPTGALTKCGVHCVSWQRQETEGAPPTPATPRSAAPQRSARTAAPTPPHRAAAPVPTPAPATPAPTPPPTPRSTCSCNPLLTPSAYTKCHRGADGRVHVTHETSHIFRHDGMGEQHVCRVVHGGGACLCCDCAPPLSLTTLSAEMRLLPAGSYIIAPPFLAQGQANLKRNIAECQLACAEDEQCATGTFILSGVDKGECWLSHKSGPRQSCTQPCQSFVKDEGAGRR